MRWFVNHRPRATIGRHSLSHARWACQLPQGGSREWAVPFIVPPGNRNVAGDFHRPYATQKFFTFHHSSDDTPSEREPGSVPIHRTAQKPQRCGRFSSPLRNVPFNRAGAQRRDWKVAIWVVASSRALSQKALSVRSIPATRAVASAVATVVVCSSFLYTGTKSGPCWRYLA